MVTDSKVLCAVLIVFAAALCLAQAATAADNSEITFYAGGFLGNSFVHETTFLQPIDAVYDNNFTGGFRWAYFLTSRFAAEGGLGFTPASIRSGGFVRSVDTYVFQANGLYHLWNGPVIPFVTGGVAAIHFSMHNHHDHNDFGGMHGDNFFNEDFGPSETDFAWSAGGGVKIPFRHNAAFRFDGRYYWAKPKFADQKYESFAEISGGVSFLFEM